MARSVLTKQSASRTRLPRSEEIGAMLDLPEVKLAIAELSGLRWTGRKGYSTRSLLGACLVKSVYALPTWTRTTELIREHHELRDALGEAPSVYACYRFAAKLRGVEVIDKTLDRVLTSLKEAIPNLGDDVAIDASDIPAYANGMRQVSKNGPERERYSDPDASWGHRSAVSTRKGGGFYGYKIHALVCAATDLPLSWLVQTAKASESPSVGLLLDASARRGFKPKTVSMDKAYDVGPVYETCSVYGCVPIIPLKQTSRVKRGEHLPPFCKHGWWIFAGRDDRRQRAKWRCPTGECNPRGTWIKASRLHTLIPRDTDRWLALRAGRASVERVFGRLKNDWSLTPIRVRGLARVRLHANLTVLSHLLSELLRARALTLEDAA